LAIFKIWQKRCKAKKYWGETVLSPQYLEKYWGECPHCPYGVGAYDPHHLLLLNVNKIDHEIEQTFAHNTHAAALFHDSYS